VNAFGLRGEAVVKYVVTGRSDGENVVVLVDPQLLDVDIRVFPGLRLISRQTIPGYMHPPSRKCVF
jgi:hypothetical protein